MLKTIPGATIAALGVIALLVPGLLRGDVELVTDVQAHAFCQRLRSGGPGEGGPYCHLEILFHRPRLGTLGLPVNP